jgi:hypothetical protein
LDVQPGQLSRSPGGVAQQARNAFVRKFEQDPRGYDLSVIQKTQIWSVKMLQTNFSISLLLLIWPEGS